MSLNPAASMWAGFTASGASPQFELPTGGTLVGGVLLVSALTAVSGSGGPTLTCYLDVLDASGTFNQVIALTAQSSAGVQTGTSSPLAVTAAAIGIYRLRWVISGTGQFVGALVAISQ